MRYVVEARLLHRAFLLTIAGFVASGVAARKARADDTPTESAAGKNAIVPAAPVLPAEVVSAMQEGRYDEAAKQLAILVQKALRPMIKHISLMYRGSRSAWATTETPPATRSKSRSRPARRAAGLPRSATSWPESSWRWETWRRRGARPRRGRASALRRSKGSTRRYLSRLRPPSARDRQPPDCPRPQGRLRALGPGTRARREPARSRQLLFAMGQASMAASDPARAIENFQHYVREYPAGADRLSVLFQLGDAQQKTNQPLLARRTWTDLAREIERIAPAQLTKEVSAIRADALYAIASTYGIPNPPDDTSLNHGVAAIRRFLAAYPAHPQRVRAAHQLGASYQARGKSTEALEAFTQFLRQDRHSLSQPRPAAIGPSSPWTRRSRLARSSRASKNSPRRSRPGRAIWRSFPTAPRAPTPSAQFSTPSS